MSESSEVCTSTLAKRQSHWRPTSRSLPGVPLRWPPWASPRRSCSPSGTRRFLIWSDPGLKLLFVGINPGLWTAATQTHFAHPGNRFYPALRLAGIVDRDLDRGEPMTDEDRAYLIERGIGITTW